MATVATFDQVLEAVEQLPDDQQASLVDVVRRRLAERGRQRVIADAQEARVEYEAGKLRPMPVDELMREIKS